MPEWDGIKPVQVGSLKNGEETIFKVSIGPIKRKWVARHHIVLSGAATTQKSRILLIGNFLCIF
jgi:hypothetical protein